MNRLEAIKKAAGKKGNKLIAEFVFDVCVDRPERLSAVEIIDRLECIDVFTNQNTVNRFIRKYIEYGFFVGEQPETRGNDFMSGFNWNPKPLDKNQFKHLKGAW
jgi:hypothetical protein